MTELYLWDRIAAGDINAYHQAYLANLPLVRFIARDFRRRGLEMRDVVGEGTVGLGQAIQAFDPRKGKFATYASFHIKNTITEAIYRNTPLRVPKYATKLHLKHRDDPGRLGPRRRAAFDLAGRGRDRPLALIDEIDRVDRQRRDHEPLHRAVDALPPRDREWVMREYELEGKRPRVRGRTVTAAGTRILARLADSLSTHDFATGT